jgi:hypothetical protein
VRVTMHRISQTQNAKKRSTECGRKSHITYCTTKGEKKNPFAIIVARPAPAPPPSSTPSPTPSRRKQQDGCQYPSPTHHHHQPVRGGHQGESGRPRRRPSPPCCRQARQML